MLKETLSTCLGCNNTWGTTDQMAKPHYVTCGSHCKSSREPNDAIKSLIVIPEHSMIVGIFDGVSNIKFESHSPVTLRIEKPTSVELRPPSFTSNHNIDVRFNKEMFHYSLENGTGITFHVDQHGKLTHSLFEIDDTIQRRIEHSLDKWHLAGMV